MMAHDSVTLFGRASPSVLSRPRVFWDSRNVTGLLELRLFRLSVIGSARSLTKNVSLSAAIPKPRPRATDKRSVTVRKAGAPHLQVSFLQKISLPYNQSSATENARLTTVSTKL